jgi:hypothetical protein
MQSEVFGLKTFVPEPKSLLRGKDNQSIDTRKNRAPAC